ncbi:hypothetical protein [Sinomonas mesophila]|uniref:hypothetical protein n=1 Tax=Sinomonas mesophila TaxID=1531955 RepID=UPI0011158444|nr:hypothetical protein [Sinomonas mesophila]
MSTTVAPEKEQALAMVLAAFEAPDRLFTPLAAPLTSLPPGTMAAVERSASATASPQDPLQVLQVL